MGSKARLMMSATMISAAMTLAVGGVVAVSHGVASAALDRVILRRLSPRSGGLALAWVPRTTT